MKSNGSILILTKDAMATDYLPIYGNTYWNGKTPNMDELASKGTVFDNYYTAAASTVMSFRSMLSGYFAHEMPFADYIPMDMDITQNHFFNQAKSRGFKGHVLWDAEWEKLVLRYGKLFPEHVVIHNIERLNQPVGPHKKHKHAVEENDELAFSTLCRVEEEVKGILSTGEKVMLWIHLPHVLNGRACYGSDIDVYDQYIGMLRKYFEDSNIFLSADHGNMNGYHGKYSYGFDVYNPVIKIPLITPKINGIDRCKDNISNVDIARIVFERIIPKREFLYSDSAYYAQPHRKISIIKDNYKYIYNKAGGHEELYDMAYDDIERNNLINDPFMDPDRKLITLRSEVYFYPFWEEAERYKNLLRKEKNKVWKKPSIFMEIRGRSLAIAKKIFVVLRKIILGK